MVFTGYGNIEFINFRAMEEPPLPPTEVIEALATLRTVARESGFCEPFVTLVREDRAPPAFHTELLPGSAVHAGVTSLVTGCSMVPLQLLHIPEM